MGKMRLSTKLIGLFLLMGLGPFMFVGLYAYQTSSEALQQDAFNRLALIRESKQAEINRYFQVINNQVLTLSEDIMIVEAMEGLTGAFFAAEEEVGLGYDQNLKENEERLRARYVQQESDTDNAPDNALSLWWPRNRVSRILQHLYISTNPYPVGEKHKLDTSRDHSEYSRLHGQFHPVLRNFVDKFGYYDLFLVEPDSGHIIYSVFKEVDFATRLSDGPYSNTNLGRVFKQALAANAGESVYLADFEPYPPSYNAPAAFIASPIYNDDGKKSGILIFQMPISRIDGIMTNDGRWEKTGLGKSGESFLVGPDFKFRSNSRYLIQDQDDFLSSLKNSHISDQDLEKIQVHKTVIGILSFKTEHVEEALTGETDLEENTVDYLGNEVLLAHAPIRMPGGSKWALIATISQQEAYKALNNLNRMMWILGIICSVVVVAVGWYFARSISRPLNEIINVVSTSSAEIATTVNQQERVSAQQAVSVNETNTTMEELGTSARQSSEQADSAASGAQKALELAEHGMGRVEEMLEEMGGTRSKVEAIGREILKLSERTGQIRDITDTVSEFANETKMLAMNAAVEAVRAGEHGKGFSVLAVETRKLADESKRSAARINDLVGEIQKATNTTVMVTDEGTKTVEQGVLIAQNTAETFREVAESVNAAAESAQQISMNVRQQSVAIKQVVEAMKSLNTGAKETSSGVGQIKTGIQTLNDAAQVLRNMV
ncbi:MAG: methyl-accepting chemotaxis protein [Magnetococcales bacterium]|nr:methyl-accepting chemotaxis protein [Magnetococcales bacterium]